MAQGSTSLAKLRGQSDTAVPQKNVMPSKKNRDSHESEGGTENEANAGQAGEGVTMGTKTQGHLAKHHKTAAKMHRKMAKHHEGLADEHHEAADHHDTMLGELTGEGR